QLPLRSEERLDLLEVLPVGVERSLLFSLAPKVFQVGPGGLAQGFGHGRSSFHVAQVIGNQQLTHIHIQASCAPEVKAFHAHSARKITPWTGRPACAALATADREEHHEKTG
ncbi:MAG: hypothetical protein DRP16_05600, partial [Candidatus Aenigmatarchaeota archaeon]